MLITFIDLRNTINHYLKGIQYDEYYQTKWEIWIIMDVVNA